MVSNNNYPGAPRALSGGIRDEPRGTTPEAVLLKTFRRLWGAAGSVGSADHKDDLWETNIGGTPHFPRNVVVIAVVMDARYPEALPFATHQFSTKAPPKFDNWVE